ncbi:MAG: methyl-accepting chemotaxis protein [Desulfuromonadia bacterium]
MKRLPNQSRYFIAGMVLGLGAPITWIVLRLLFFVDHSVPLYDQLVGEIFSTAEHLTLYLYMTLGTSIVMAFLGGYIGKNADELHERTVELDRLHLEVATQKELFENRYKILDNNIKKFHQISSRIQKSIVRSEIISLCFEGLHSILGYERVNIFLRENGSLKVVASSIADRHEFDTLTLPLDERIGIIYRCYADQQIFLVEDMGSYPDSYRVQPPFCDMDIIRSKSFILCPIIVKGNTIGIFGIDNKHSRRSLNETDVDTIKLFADLFASAFIRCNLIEDINTLVNNLESTFSSLLANRKLHSQTVQSLMKAVTSLTESTQSLANGAEQILHSIDATSDSANRISTAIEQVSSNLDALSEVVYKSASAMEEITTTLNNVKQNANVSHTVSSRVKQQADISLDMVRKTMASLEEIEQTVTHSHDSIVRLAHNSSRIENIISVINDITKRTNLLALNASIIAAQAGEYGKSFGVVADEIRNLSLQTGQSTGAITEIIDEIMTESRTAADTIRSAKETVSGGVDLGRKTCEALNVITASAAEAMEMTEEIKLATEEQARSVELVTRSIEDVSSMTTQIFNASKEQAHATRKIAGEVETIKMKTMAIVKSTANQVKDTESIQTEVEKTGVLIESIFGEIEGRSKESARVIKALDAVRQG